MSRTCLRHHCLAAALAKLNIPCKPQKVMSNSTVQVQQLAATSLPCSSCSQAHVVLSIGVTGSVCTSCQSTSKHTGQHNTDEPMVTDCADAQDEELDV